MFEIKKMSECSIEQKVEAWNKGFEGYYFNMETTAEAFEKRGVTEDLNEELSIVAFDGNHPVGIVRNGLRGNDGRKVSWNGGTGVAKSVRGQGVGKRMMEKTIEWLRDSGVQLATLEAVSENKAAIELYRKIGYEIVDEVEFMQLKGNVEKCPEELKSGQEITLKSATIEEAGSLDFYRHDFTWQTQWQSVKDGEALIAYNAEGKAVGYAYFRKSKDENGKHIATTLYQCVVNPLAEDPQSLTARLITEAFEGFSGEINRVAVNIPVEMNKLTHQVLAEVGFKVTTKQVMMAKEL